MSSAPAILDGEPLFPKKVPIANPVLPSAAELLDGLDQILQSGIVTNGPFTHAFEQAVADHLNVKHAVAVSSATSGLMIAYRCLDLRGEVIVPSFTFMATVSAMIWAGLTPVFADVDLETGNLDPATAEAAITPETSALVAVHNSGNPADIAELEAVAARHDLPLIFDAAHAFGSLWEGQPIGAQGHVQVFSLTPTKLVVAGEGGMVTTNDDQLAARLRIAREYGNRGDYNSEFAGINARLPEFSALLGQHSMRHLNTAVTRRNEIAALYRQRLGQLPGIRFQLVRDGNRSSYKDFSITLDATAFGLTRNELAAVLAAENIDTRKYYDPPVHRHQAYQAYAPADGSLPNTDFLSGAILNLPIWSKMEESIASDVCLAIEKAHAFSSGVRARLRQNCIRDQSAATP
jgi:dTDP-4-amino-4,6-dideoxygalactose transaminase